MTVIKKNVMRFGFFSFIIVLSLVFLLVVAKPVAAASTMDTSLSLSVNLINQDPDPAVAGDIVELRIGVSNMGGIDANNVVFEIDPSYPFELLPGESDVQSLGTILGYQGVSDIDTRVLKYKLRIDKDATAGTYELNIKTYEKGSDFVTVSKLLIDVESQDSAEVIYINQVDVIPGKITPLTFTIYNVGSSPLRDLTFTWENGADIILPVGSDNTKYVKYLDVDQSVDVSYDVVASATASPDLYKLDLNLNYYDSLDNAYKNITSKAGIYVGGATDFDVAFSGSSSGEYSFAIANIGSVSASSVTVSVPSQQGWRVSGSNSAIIGNLNEGDYTIASFTLQKTTQMNFGNFSRNNSSSSRTGLPENNADDSILLNIIYTDSRGNRNTIEKTISVSSSDSVNSTFSGASSTASGFGARSRSSSSQFGSAVAWIVVAAFFVAFVFVIQRKYKLGKMEDSKYTYFVALQDLFGSKKKIGKK